MKRVISTCLTLCLSAALALPASALDYSIDAPGNPDYGDPTSIEVVHTADGGAMKNEDTACLLPPPGSGLRWKGPFSATPPPVQRSLTSRSGLTCPRSALERKVLSLWA